MALSPTSDKMAVMQLALFGGAASIPERIMVGRPNTGDREMFNGLVDRIWSTKLFTNRGPLVTELEKKLAEFLEVKHAVTVCNATIGLEVAVTALELRGEVIVPSFTFVATVHAMQRMGLTIVFCDVDKDTHTLDVEKARALIKPGVTCAILAVHLWGCCADVEALDALGQEHGVKIIYDAAHAFASRRNGKMVASNGVCEVFSLHATKFFHTCEGGLITTTDDALAHRLRLMTNFGFQGLDNVACLGTNAKMSEMHAAMGLSNFEILPSLLASNRNNYKLYQASLADIPGLTLWDLPTDEANLTNAQYIVVLLDNDVYGLHRDKVVQLLSAEGVVARRYFFPGVHRMAPYVTLMPNAGDHLPITKDLCTRVFLLPTGPNVTADHIATVGRLLRFFQRNAAEITEQLALSN